jgi:hypothetical protein
VTRVTQETASDIVCMLDTFEDVGRNWELRPFSELSSLGLALEVDFLDPAMMLGSSCLKIEKSATVNKTESLIDSGECQWTIIESQLRLSSLTSWSR